MLNKTKITATVCALVITAGIGIPVLAFGALKDTNAPRLMQKVEMTEEQKAEFEARREERFTKMGEMPELTDEQKAEMEARRAEMETACEEMEAKMKANAEKYATLTDEQKAELDAINAEIEGLCGKLKDKYAEFGIDIETPGNFGGTMMVEGESNGERLMIRRGFGGQKMFKGDEVSTQ